MNNFLLAFTFFLISFVSRFSGKGGGNLYVLSLVFSGLNMHEAVPISQLSLFFSAFVAIVIFHKKKTLLWKFGVPVVLFAILGAFIAGIYSYFFSENFLRKTFSIILVLNGILMFLFINRKNREKKEKYSLFYYKLVFDGAICSVNIIFVLIASFVSGFIASLLGLGGGIIMVPVLLFLFKIPMKAIVAITPLLVLGVSGFGFAGHALHVNIDYLFTGVLIFASVLASYLASLFVLKSNEKVLKLVFALSSLASGVIMWFQI